MGFSPSVKLEVNDSQLIPPGYKQTEVGVIPEDWEVKALGDIGESLIGLTYKPVDVRSDGILVLRSSNIQDGTLRFDNNVFVETEVSDRIMVRPGDILICVRNGSRDLIGKCVQLDEQARGMTFGAFMAVFRTSLYRFVHHQFQSRAIKRQVHEHLGATINQITNKSLNSFCIPLPPTKAEQEAIAEALSDADALIESLEQLLTKKRQLKQGAMQELLTGKKRLPGFEINPGYKQTEVGMIPEDWEVMPFVRAVQSYIDYRGRTPRKLGLSWGGGDILALSANNVQMGRIDYDKGAYYGSDELYRKWMVQGECEPGDVLLTMEAPLGNVTQVPDSKKYILSQRVLLIKPKTWLLRDFLTHYMKGFFFQNQLSLNSTGSTAKGIQRKKLDELPVGLPPTLPEQTAIATVLSDMDAEITALEAKLVKARQLKQGMMQELLTGRIRLVESGK